MTRSGTNQYHGELFEFLRNNVLNANSFFANATCLAQPHLTRNDFGVTTGGPILKNKTFFFFDFNGIRALTGATSSEAGVPDAAERVGNFGELCSRAGGTFNSAGICSNPAGQIYDPYTSNPDAENNATGRAPIPFDNLATYASPGNPNIAFGLGNLPSTPGNLIDPVGAKLIQAFPLPNLNIGTSAYDLYHNWVATATSPFNQQSLDIKLDQHFSDKTVASVRFSHEWDAGENPNFFGSVYDTSTQGLTKHSALVGDVNFLHTFSPATLVSVSLGYGHNWYPTDGVAASFGGFDPAKILGEASLGLLSFEVDLWGKLRRATEAARANLLSAEANRQAVITTLISDVASYLTLRELDYELEISNHTLETRQESLDLTKSRQKGGVGTLLDLRQAEQLVDTAAETIPVIEQEIEQTENQIHLLLGEPPGPVPRGQSLTAQEIPPEVPAGLTSALLERRPDIRAAEQDLVAANAEIGVARAQYFPQLTLSGFLGGQSTQLTRLISGPTSAWTLAPQLAQPIFTARRLKSNVRLAEAQRDHALVQYEKTIQTAFTEVSNGLIAHQRVRESRVRQEALVYALEDRLRLAYLRYRGRVDTQLDALDADRDLFSAELSLSQIRLNETLTIVQLYKALGGGWQ